MNVFDKIKKARELLGQTQSEFADNIGVTQKDVSLIELGGKKFIPNKYLEYLSKNGFDLNTLFKDNLQLNWIETNLVEETNEVYKTVTDKIIDHQQIPLFGKEAIAGITPIFSDLNNEQPIDYLHIPNAPKCDGAIYASGDSMYPLVKSGDITAYKIITDIKNDIYWGQMYILDIEIAGDTFQVIKYIKKGNDNEHILLVSENKHHQEKEIHLSKIRGLAQVKIIVRIP